MKKYQKAIVISGIVLVVILLAAFLFGRSIYRSGLPDYNEDIRLTGISKPVTVYRDAYAIPHVYAGNEYDLYKAVGYLSAQDRMWQMDLLRRVSLGRLSEIFGDDFIKTDLLLRSLRFSEKSGALVESTDTSIINALQAYTDGVNAYIRDHKGNFPFEFKVLGYEPEPWQIIHSLNLIGYMAWDLKAGWSELVLESIAQKVDSIHLAELLPDVSFQKSYVFREGAGQLLANNRLMELNKLEELGLDIFSGSNNWAVSGAKTINGKPLLANDMHLGFNIPGIWMQMHQVIDGKLNVTGLVLPGQPLVIVGHNDSIAWGMTNTYVDNLDFYEEEVNPEDPGQYRYNGEWRNFKVCREVIKSKGEEHRESYRLSHRGPVISEFKDIKDRVLTMHWVGEENSNEMRSIYLVNRADNWGEFKDAFASFRSISQNIVYADKQGNIGLYACAGVPLRQRDRVFAVLPGDTSLYDWQGMIPFEELPFEYNPERGYVSSANNRTADSTYPYHIGTWYDMPYRLDRINVLLSENESYSVSDFKRIQNDQHSVFSELFLAKLLPAVQNSHNLGHMEKKALQALEKWDYTLSVSSAAATISEYWWYHFMDKTYRDELGRELFDKFSEVNSIHRASVNRLLQTGNSAWLDNVNTEKTEQLEDIAVSSFKAAIKELEEKKGSDLAKWKWGDHHTFTLSHPIAKVKIMDFIFRLNQGPFKVGGSFHTVSPYRYTFFKPEEIVHGASHRSIYDLSDWDNSISVIPTGMSGIPSSDHYCDQTELYVSGEYHPDYFSKESVVRNKRYEMKFLP
ncbi:MAG: penicillin acylase family protein [Bacteroidales bacterium]|nr:penicillin acylase family protein [Bacteroidales bacterium]